MCYSIHPIAILLVRSTKCPIICLKFYRPKLLTILIFLGLFIFEEDTLLTFILKILSLSVQTTVVTVSRGVDDAATCQADELCRGVPERTAEVSHEATGVYPSHPGATVHVLHASRRRAGLPVALSVGDDRLQLLLLHVSRSTPAPDSSTVNIIMHVHLHVHKLV